MLTRPSITDSVIRACLQDHFALHATQIDFLPIGADANSAAFQVIADDGTAYFLKLRRGTFNEIAATVPAHLRAQGIKEVMAPLATMAGPPWARAEGFIVLLYPFFTGTNAFETPLTREQWIAFGASLGAIHATTLPAGLATKVPREDYAPRYRQAVTAYLGAVRRTTYADPSAAGLAAFFRAKHDEIEILVSRAEHLAEVLRARPAEPPCEAERLGHPTEGPGATAPIPRSPAPFQHPALVPCHADLHGGNLLLGASGDLAIVDWDDPILAPRERDLMFVGGGIGGIWDQPDEATWFYEGYGPVAVDRVTLAYYRYERIVADLAAYADEIFNARVSPVDRAEGLRQVKGQFHPGRVVEIAHRSWPFPE